MTDNIEINKAIDWLKTSMLARIDRPMLGWVKRAAGMENHFPVETLKPKPEFEVKAERFLEETRRELPEALFPYFDSSRPRYSYTLALALEAHSLKVLDIGCSPGHLAIAMTKAGSEVSGIDLNTEWLAKYPEGWAGRLNVRQVQIENEPVPEGNDTFDLVVFTEVLEHIGITDPLKILSELRRVLKPGGMLLMSTPNVANISNLLALASGQNIFWDPSIFYGSLDRHNREYTPREVEILFNKTSFRSFQIGYLNTWSNWNSTTGLMVHRILPFIEQDPLLKNHPISGIDPF